MKTIRVPDELYDEIETRRRDGETMAETIRRMLRGPEPERLAEVVDGKNDASVEIRAALERRREHGRRRRGALRDRFE